MPSHLLAKLTLTLDNRHLDQDAARTATVLNLDVLRTIIHFLPINDVKQVAVVSRPLHEEASRELLSRGVHLRHSADKLQSFCNFMLQREPPLFPYLKTLKLEHYAGAYDVYRFDLLKVISLATFLRDLRIRWSDYLFTTKSDKRLSITLPQLRNLRRLEIWTRRSAADKHVAEAVLNLSSQLHSLDVPSDTDNELGVDFPNLLAERQKSLHRLRICYRSLTDTPWSPFPSVRVLYLTIGNKLPSLPHLVQIFPSLRELSVSAVGFEIDFVHPSLEHVRARDEALAFQRAGKGWKSLDVLTAATVGDLWVLRLTCPVGAVSLGHYDVGTHAAFVDVLSGARPRKVSIHLAYAQYCLRPDDLPNLFVFPSAAEDGFGLGTGAATHAILKFSISSFHLGQTTTAIVVSGVSCCLQCSEPRL